jgi:hypothetical protein
MLSTKLWEFFCTLSHLKLVNIESSSSTYPLNPFRLLTGDVWLLAASFSADSVRKMRHIKFHHSSKWSEKTKAETTNLKQIDRENDSNFQFLSFSTCAKHEQDTLIYCRLKGLRT